MRLERASNNAGASRGFVDLEAGPTGTFIGRLIDVKDEEQVEVRNWEGDGTSLKNVTRFLFGYKDGDNLHMVQTWEMTQSPSEKSALFKLLTNLKGESPVFDGEYDYCDEVGHPCQINVASKTSKLGRTYNYVMSVSPLLESLAAEAPALEDFDIPGGRNVPIDSQGGEPELFKA